MNDLQTKDTPVTALTVPTTKADVPGTIKLLQEKLDSLKGTKEDKVSLDISYNGINIKNVKTVGELLEISSSVHARAAAYNAEIVRYKLTDMNIKAFTVSDKTSEEWAKVIDKAIFELINSSEIAKLESAIKKLSNHLDEATKFQNELAEIMAGAGEAIA